MKNRSILSIWNELQLPKNKLEYNSYQVEGTNTWIFKDHQGKMGFLLAGIRYPRNIPKFKNIQILKIASKEIVKKGGVSIINNCLEVNLDSRCDADLFSTILGHMAEIEPSGQYSSQLFLDVLKNVNHLVRLSPPPPSKEEVIGAWGEMELLHSLLSKTSSFRSRKLILSGWEANGLSRDIIDLRFPLIGDSIAIEVKTSVSDRKHHINGFAQITVPEDYSRGFLASIIIRETDLTSGYSNKNLIDKIKNLSNSSKEDNEEFLILLDQKLNRRGINICNDDRFFFQSSLDSFRFIDMTLVPRPIKTDDIDNLEWNAKVNHCLYLNIDELLELF